jgi:hypothetical protein
MCPVKPMHVTGLTDALCFSRKKHTTVRRGLLAYIRSHPGSSEADGVCVKLQKHRKNSPIHPRAY